MHNALIKGFGITALAVAVAACGGSGDGSGDGSIGGNSTGTMSLGLTDAPVTTLSEANLNITSVEVKPAEGKSVTIQIETEDGRNSLDINLLDFQGGKVAQLFEGQEFPAGQYQWIRLHLGADPYVVEELAPDQKVFLFVPSGRQTGLKLNGGFAIPAGGSADFTIDFDVKKSILNPGGNAPGGSNKYILKPAHRLIDNTKAGSIIGDVDYASINQDADLAACDYQGSVYVYKGDLAVEELEDLNADNLETDEGPLVVVPVKDQDTNGIYGFKAAFLPAGQYTIAYSCQDDDNESTETLEFLGRQTVTVVANEVTEAGTIPLAP